MAELSKTARASMNAGMAGNVKTDPFDTNEKKINELRKQRVAKLAVNRYDFIDALLEEHDKLVVLNGILATRAEKFASLALLEAKVAELEAELERVNAFQAPEVTEVTPAQAEPAS